MCTADQKFMYADAVLLVLHRDNTIFQLHIVATIRNPIESAFGIFKSNFRTLQTGVPLLHEDVVVLLCRYCIVLQLLCIGSGDIDYSYGERNDYCLNGVEDDFFTTETQVDNRQRDAFMY